MKVYLLSFILLPILFLFISCAETEDVKTGNTDGADQLLRIESLVEQLENLEIGVPEDWEKTRDPVERAAYARFLFSVGQIPVSLDFNDIYTVDPVVQAEYHRAQLINRFGDIPEVHTFADNDLRNALGIYPTDKEIIATEEAYTFLFPTRSGKNKIPLHRYLDEEEKALAIIRKEDPQKWTEHTRAQLIKEHGDIPDAHIIADFMEKIELGIPIDKEEYETYMTKIEELQSNRFSSDQFYVVLEAQSQLGIWMQDIDKCRLNLFRTAIAEAIPIVQIEWHTIDIEHEFCQSTL